MADDSTQRRRRRRILLILLLGTLAWYVRSRRAGAAVWADLTEPVSTARPPRALPIAPPAGREPAPGPVPAPGPGPGLVPASETAPEPALVPGPGPAPPSGPVPASETATGTEPAPAPETEPKPVHGPAPAPETEPKPVHGPGPAPEPVPPVSAAPRRPASTPDDAAPYGEGSARALPDGSPPSPEYTIKGNPTSMLFHPPTSPYFTRTKAQVWFRTAEDARAAGFTQWSPRKRTKE